MERLPQIPDDEAPAEGIHIPLLKERMLGKNNGPELLFSIQGNHQDWARVLKSESIVNVAVRARNRCKDKSALGGLT